MEYKRRNAIFGNDAEYYAASLFMMLKNPNGTRRPDLLSMGGTFTPRLTMEVKSGKNMKGILNDYQLHYALTLNGDYSELQNRNIIEINHGMFDGIDWNATRRQNLSEDIAYYYNIINRADEVRSYHITKPFSSILLEWKEQFIVPNEFGFYAFAVSRSMRTKEHISEVISALSAKMKYDAREKRSHYDERDIQTFQNIYATDILSIFLDEPDITTKYGRKRVENLRRIYSGLDTLEKITIEGPNKTTIYILAEQDHVDLFDSQLRQAVAKRIPIIERIHRERREALDLLKNISEYNDIELFDDLEEVQTKRATDPSFLTELRIDEFNHLRRLSQWLNVGEIPFYKYLEEVPF
ncbi:hypothetical protein HYV89_02805 [Candidatus Woesearchaeota archaeon]|nr:hypothetical protein [Candidatus Woesearchaeota archaeon]